VRRIEEDFIFPEPFGGEADHFLGFKKLINPYILIPQAPNMSQIWAGLNVNSQDFHSRPPIRKTAPVHITVNGGCPPL
jgi:hypothetical protein